MRRVLLVSVIAAVSMYYFGLRGRLTSIEDGAPHATMLGSDVDARRDVPRKISSIDPPSDLGIPTDAQTPAVVGRALEENARRALEALTRGYDTRRSDPQGEGISTRPLGPGPAIASVPPNPPAAESAAPVDAAKDIILLHEELAELKTQKQSDIVLIDQARARAGDLETELLTQREKSVALIDQLAEAKRNAATAEKDRAKLESVSADLATVRAYMTQAARAAVGRSQALRQAETARSDAEAAELNERNRADLLAKKLTDAEGKLAAQKEALEDTVKTQPVSLARPDDSDRAMVAALSSALPADVPARVVLRYARGSEPARRRAEGLGLALKGQHLEVTDPVETQAAALDSVTFFYKRDEGSAERIAGILTVAKPIQGRLPATGSMPRPGTIDVAIAK